MDLFVRVAGVVLVRCHTELADAPDSFIFRMSVPQPPRISSGFGSPIRFWGYMGVYWDNGKYNGSCYLGFRM